MAVASLGESVGEEDRGKRRPFLAMAEPNGRGSGRRSAAWGGAALGRPANWVRRRATRALPWRPGSGATLARSRGEEGARRWGPCGRE
jgi:hypothetical protein